MLVSQSKIRKMIRDALRSSLYEQEEKGGDLPGAADIEAELAEFEEELDAEEEEGGGEEEGSGEDETGEESEEEKTPVEPEPVLDPEAAEESAKRELHDKLRSNLTALGGEGASGSVQVAVRLAREEAEQNVSVRMAEVGAVDIEGLSQNQIDDFKRSVTRAVSDISFHPHLGWLEPREIEFNIEFAPAPTSMV